MFGHADLNGFNYWANEPFNPGPKGRIVLKKLVVCGKQINDYPALSGRV
jgi:hypothetical protein